MAREVIERLVDDMTGETADETVRFGLDGRTYSIDLTEKNADELREVFAPYVAAGLPEGSGGGRRLAVAPRSRRARAVPNGDAGTIRKWAQDNGWQVSGRGRISREIVAAYEAAVA